MRRKYEIMCLRVLDLFIVEGWLFLKKYAWAAAVGSMKNHMFSFIRIKWIWEGCIFLKKWGWAAGAGNIENSKLLSIGIFMFLEG